MKLVKDQQYSRQEISKLLGGSQIAFLPFKDGKVTYGCFKTDERFNPGAPDEVIFGRAHNMRDVEKSAEMVYAQGQNQEAIPIFLFQRDGYWKYVGNYCCTDLKSDTETIEEKKRQYPRRGEFKGILYFEKV